MAGKTPLTQPLEYTRGAGPFFPGAATQATQAGVQAAIETINGQSAANITIAPGPSTGATVNVTGDNAGSILIGVSVKPAPSVATVGATYPATPVQGQLHFLTVAPGPHLYCWTGTAWAQA